MDIEQRMDLLERDCKRFDLKVNDLETVVLGPSPNRSNGLNGRLNILTKKVEDTIDWANNLWNVRRRDECIGLAAVRVLRDELDKQKQEDSQVRVANVNVKGVYIMSVLNFVAIIAVAIIGLLKIA